MKNDTILKACRLQKTPFTPVWMMRQAGRYMEEYRKLRSKYSFLEMCKTPELATEVTLQPIKKIPFDAAIIFSDILVPLEGMGIAFEFDKNEGPVIKNPIKSGKDVENIKIIEPEKDVKYLLKAIKMVKKELNNTIPLIGFSAAPFTLASYIIEGGHSRNYIKTKALMYNDPELWHKLMNNLSQNIIVYLSAQIESGVDLVQVFDSWVGCLSENDYREFILPYSRKIFQTIKAKNTPAIHFGTDVAHLLELMKMAGGDVIGIDWRMNLDKAWQRLGRSVGIQGNLDSVALFAKPKELTKRIKEIIDLAKGQSGHIFNLGHGILPETPVENVILAAETVHEYSENKYKS